MTRTVRQISTKQNLRQDFSPRPFSSFEAEHSLVLLGEPGAGKTYLFRQAAAAEGGRYLTARAFLSTPAQKLSGQAIFIDGLDEKRAGRTDRNTVDALVTKLFEVNPSKVRISCRAADWLGESDLAGLQPYFEQYGDALVLLLKGLSLPEQVAVLATEGADSAVANGFLTKATERGLGDFLENPQNLIMLWRAVQAGNWPATRKELFDLSTQLMLQEFNSERAREGGGSFTAIELRPVAGAVCAARLISDIDAISLVDQDGTADIPGYRSLSFFPHEYVLAALGRRIFETGPEVETVDYAHRTTAEFLAAEFLADCVRKGSPFGRIIALMGVDGHPAAELRGLHAWLAIHLPEHADELIEADPYGVMTYGDAASLPTSSCTYLMRALDRLSKDNPWFRSGDWQSKAIGALARKDMIEEFRAILGNPASEFGIRSVVIDALMLGPPIREMLPDLATVLAQEDAPYAERSHALATLLHLEEAGENIIYGVYKQLGSTRSDVRLRAEIITLLYGRPYGIDEVIDLANDSFNIHESHSMGLLWGLYNKLPLADIPLILDRLSPPSHAAGGLDLQVLDVGSFYTHILARAWSTSEPLNPGQALAWLLKRAKLSSGQGSATDLRSALRDKPEKMIEIARHFFRTITIDNQIWLALHRFREALLFELSADELLYTSTDELNLSEPGSDRELMLFEFSLSLCYQATQPLALNLFEKLWTKANSSQRLLDARIKATAIDLPDKYFSSAITDYPDTATAHKLRLQDFDRDVGQIRAGQHLGWQQLLGKVYFGLYNDTDRNLPASERISAWLGEERAQAALEGLIASVARDNIPTFSDVVALTIDHKRYDWWFALAAGLNELWRVKPDLSDFSDDFLKAMLVFDLANPLWELRDRTEFRLVQPWRKNLTDSRPELVLEAYLPVIKLRLSRNEQFIEGLRELLNDETFAPYRADVVLELLHEYASHCRPDHLDELLEGAIKWPETHERLLVKSRSALTEMTSSEQQRSCWLATAFCLSPVEFQSEVYNWANAHPEFVFDLRDKVGLKQRAQVAQTPPLPVLQFMARLAGSIFPDTPYPLNGWGGDQNPWDAADWVRSLVSTLSAIPTQDATKALKELSDDNQLLSYRNHILGALASQQQLRRDAEYDRPNWLETIAALENGPPATVSDLHALLVSHLVDLKHRIARTNTDIYKQFWNLDSYSRIKEPRPEEACRDSLINLMRPYLLPLGITVEPEGHMVADKRADISVGMPSRKILCELKRDYHSEVWEAALEQLERFYAHDPDSKGLGVYAVFWFGTKRPTPIPTPPNGRTRPQAAAEMEKALIDLLPEDSRQRLAVIVFDVSGSV